MGISYSHLLNYHGELNPCWCWYKSDWFPQSTEPWRLFYRDTSEAIHSELELSESENTADFMAGTFLRETDLFAMFVCQVQHPVFSASKNFTFCLISEYLWCFMHFSLLIHTFFLEHHYCSCHITSANSKITWKGRDKPYSPNKKKKKKKLNPPNFSHKYRDVRVRAEKWQSTTTAKPEVTQFKVKSPGKPDTCLLPQSSWPHCRTNCTFLPLSPKRNKLRRENNVVAANFAGIAVSVRDHLSLNWTTWLL